MARLRGFTAAARDLGVSVAGASQSVRQLEGQLKVVLFTRTTRSVALTEAGRSLAERAGPGPGQAGEALRNVSAPAGEAVGRLRLPVPEVAVLLVIEPVLPIFRARHPRVEVRSSPRTGSWTSSPRAMTGQGTRSIGALPLRSMMPPS